MNSKTSQAFAHCPPPEANPANVFFHPRTIAVIGAGRDPDSMGGTLLRNLIASYRGSLYAVNPHAREIQGLPVFGSITEIPGPIDLAFVCIPAASVAKAIHELMELGVGGLVIISAGFSETGTAGKEREQEIKALVTRAGIPTIGPNCLGLLSTNADWPVNGTFSSFSPLAGNIALGTQSGALGFIVPDCMRQWNTGLSKLISLGNKLDVDENRLLEFFSADPETTVISLYLESLTAPRRFLEVTRQVAAKKPVIVLKAGRTAAGHQAAGSHTAALANPDRLVNGLLRQSGAIRAETLEELMGTAALLAKQPAPDGRRVALLTNAGGPGVIAADALEAAHFTIPELSKPHQLKLRSFLPPHASVRNPIDLVGSTSPAAYRSCLEVLLASDEVDSILVEYVPRLVGTSSAILEEIDDIVSASPISKAILAIIMETGSPPSTSNSQRHAVPTFQFPELAVSALQHAADYRERIVRRSIATCQETSDILIASDWEPSDPSGWLPPDRVQCLLSACGFSLPDWRLADSVKQACHAAEDIGYPVVVKAVSPTVLHKRISGGVAIDLRTQDEVADAARRILRNVPDTQGLFLQRFAPGDSEWIIGIRREPDFGHVVALGPGGSLVETIADVHFRLLPITRLDAAELIDESTIAARLLAPVSKQGLLESLLRVSRMVSAIPRIEEADFNPVALGPEQAFPSILDARIYLGSKE